HRVAYDATAGPRCRYKKYSRVAVHRPGTKVTTRVPRELTARGSPTAWTSDWTDLSAPLLLPARTLTAGAKAPSRVKPPQDRQACGRTWAGRRADPGHGRVPAGGVVGLDRGHDVSPSGQAAVDGRAHAAGQQLAQQLAERGARVGV